MSTADPTSQQADQPPSQPTAQPTPPPASPNADQQYASSVRVPRRLVRRTDERMVGGVCAGLADHLGSTSTLVRLLTVLVTVLGFGSVVIAYLVAWVIVPKDVDVFAPGPGRRTPARRATRRLEPRVTDQQRRVGVVAEQPVDAGVQQRPRLGVHRRRAARVVVAHRPGQHLQPGQVCVLDQPRRAQQPGAGDARPRRRSARPRAARRGVHRSSYVVGSPSATRSSGAPKASTSCTSGRSVRSRSQPQVGGLEGLQQHTGATPVEPVVAQRVEHHVLEREPDRGEVRRRLELDVQPDPAAPVPRLLGEQHQQLVEGGDLEPPVPQGVPRPPARHGLHGAQRLELGQGEVLAEPAGRPRDHRAPWSCAGRRTPDGRPRRWCRRSRSRGATRPRRRRSSPGPARSRRLRARWRGGRTPACARVGSPEHPDARSPAAAVALMPSTVRTHMA